MLSSLRNLKFLSLLLVFISCKVAKDYQIECNSVSVDATYIVDITISAKKELSDLSLVKLDAIDGVLFRGITGNNCVSQKPMISKAKSEVQGNSLLKKIYGKSRGYNNYITNVSVISSNPIINSTTKVYQFKYRVSINKDLLRKDLISAGLVTPLNNGF